MSDKTEKAAWRQVLGVRFFINFLFTLLATSWVPLLKMEAEFNGEIVQTNSIPVYKCYQDLILNFGSMREELVWSQLKPVGVHLFLCFAVTFVIWWMVAKSEQKRAKAAKNAEES